MLRFGGGEAEWGVRDIDIRAYLASLNAYFHVNPYKRWFDSSFEQLLRGMGVSYYPGHTSAALHTDLCTPLATAPTWSGLSEAERNALESDGGALWHSLVEILQPDVIIISVRRAYLSKILFGASQKSRVIHEVNGPNRKYPFLVEAGRIKLESGKTPLFVFGKAAQTPFGLVSKTEKRKIGERIMESLDE